MDKCNINIYIKKDQLPWTGFVKKQRGLNTGTIFTRFIKTQPNSITVHETCNRQIYEELCSNFADL